MTIDDPNARNCDATVGDLAVAAQITVDCTYTTTTADGVATIRSNQAVVDAHELPPTPSNTVSTSVARRLAVTKTVDETTAVSGEDLHYHVTLENVGDVALTEVTLADANAPDCAGPVEDLDIGEQVTIDCAYTTTFADAGTYTNVATAEAAQTGPVDSNAVSTTVRAAQGVDLAARAGRQAWVGVGTVNTDGSVFVTVPPPPPTP